jgi:amidase
MLLHILASPRPDRAHAIGYQLPMPRHERIDAFRVAIWSDDEACPVSADVRTAVERAGDILESLGAMVSRTARPPINADASSQLGLWLVAAATAPSMSDEDFVRYHAIATSPDTPPEVAASLGSFTATHRDWMAADVARQHLRVQWNSFFQSFDALVCPVAMTHAFPHTQEGSLPERTVTVDDVERPYMELLWWTVLIGGVYLPATVIPVGTSADGMPIGVQIVGPYLEDRTALAVARAIRNELGPIAFPN